MYEDTANRACSTAGSCWPSSPCSGPQHCGLRSYPKPVKSSPPPSSLPAPRAKQYATASPLSLPSVKNKLINLPGATKTLSSWPLDLRRRSSRWRLKEFRVCFEMRFDSGRGSGAKRQRWSCERLSPSAPAWVREQQEGGGGRGKHGASLGAAGPPLPLEESHPFRCEWPRVPLQRDPGETEQFPELSIPREAPISNAAPHSNGKRCPSTAAPSGAVHHLPGRGEEHLC